MKTIPLTEYLKEKRQAEVAAEIGVTPAAIWQMVRAGRQVQVTVHDDGRVVAHEIKPLGKHKAAA
ncbi:Cro/CI family transcriptional regulator [uncultured Marinobacter sp.]|uniref:Cro/CI family transcriptional regulator n=1 Tax=uncultured Marinobacter sp. TaxID=187379 RepID=UPI0030D9F319|tara:strand:+ start:137 stop:331 length:195 start_codon:yes stop_codon:yes gene_type:complete